MREQDGFDKCDKTHFDLLLHGCIREAAELDAVLVHHLDRKTSLLSPIEHGVLLIGVYELKHCVDIPYRVAINEAVELAKSSAAPTATSTSTACSTRQRPTCGPSKCRPAANDMTAPRLTSFASA